MSKIGIVMYNEANNIVRPEIIYEQGPFAEILNNSEKIKAEINNIYTNYFPFYSKIVLTTGMLKKSVNSLYETIFTDKSLSNIIPDIEENISDNNKLNIGPKPNEKPKPAEQPGPNKKFNSQLMFTDNIHRYYLVTCTDEKGIEYKSLETAYVYSKKELQERMEECSTNINKIAAANKNVNFYLFAFNKLQDTKFFEEIISYEESTKALVDQFFNKLDKSITYSYFDVLDIEERYKNFFKTDHHWTPEGLYKGYAEIIKLLSIKIPNIGKTRERVEKYDFKIKLSGYMGRVTSYFDIKDDFYVYDYNLPPHEPELLKERIEIYKNGNYNKDKLADHYQEFYGYPDNFYYNTNTTERNLLIIGDSFSWSVSELVASHFDKTYIFYPWIFTEGSLDYNKFINENKITDVIYMQASERLLFNGFNDAAVDKIIIR
jgi:hypothetical protein